MIEKPSDSGLPLGYPGRYLFLCAVMYARTHAPREPVREASRSTCSIRFSPSGPLVAWQPGYVSSPASPGLSLITTRPETPGRRLDTCVTSLICGHHMSPSTHPTALSFPSCRCHPVTTAWESGSPASHSACAGHLVSSVPCLGGVTTVRIRVCGLAPSKFENWNAMPQPCKAMR